MPVLTNVQKTAEKELDFPHFSQDQHLAEKKEKSRKPLSLLDFLAERMGFEPMCDCSQTDFESCSHLVLSCLPWSVEAVLETAKTLVLQRVSDAPTGIDQLHIRKNQSSN